MKVWVTNRVLALGIRLVEVELLHDGNGGVVSSGGYYCANDWFLVRGAAVEQAEKTRTRDSLAQEATREAGGYEVR